MVHFDTRLAVDAPEVSHRINLTLLAEQLTVQGAHFCLLRSRYAGMALAPEVRQLPCVALGPSAIIGIKAAVIWCGEVFFPDNLPSCCLQDVKADGAGPFSEVHSLNREA